MILKNSGRNDELRKSNLYFLDMMFKGDAQALLSIPLRSIIISYMQTVTQFKAKDTCYAFLLDLTLIF